MFHQVAFFRDPLYYVWGRHSVRLNVSAGKQWSVVGLAEVGANSEPAFRAGRDLDPLSEITVTTGATEGLFIAAGHEGDGIALSPITAQIIAEWIAEGSPGMDVSSFKVERFSNHHPR